MKFMSSLQNKFLILFVFISIIPIVMTMLYVSNVTIKTMTENIEQSSVSQLKNIDAIIYEKSKNIQRFLDTVYANEEINEIIKSDSCNYTMFETQMKRCAVDFEEISGIAFITPSSNVYTYNVNISSVDVLRMQIMYNRIDESPGELTWFGNAFPANEVYDKDMVMAVTTCNSTDINGSYTQIAKVYIYVKTNIFNDAFGDVGDNTYIMFDSEGTRLSGIGQEKYMDILNSNVTLFETIFANDEGIVQTKQQTGANITIVHHSSKLTDFKYIKIYETDLLYKRTNDMRVYIAILLIFLFLAGMIVYAAIINRITKPITVVANRMKNLSLDNFDKKIDFDSEGEVGNIVNGYNRMIGKISDMIEEVKEKEKQKKESEIKALNYQINPHFLHNTLAAIRIVALKHNDSEVSQAIFDVNRILKSVFSDSSGFITVKEEIKLLNSFTRLLGLRYNGRINFSININEDMGDVVIPSMIIQPLVENAVMHGVAPKMNDSSFVPQIGISIEKEDSILKIDVSDNGIGMEAEVARKVLVADGKRTGGVGMANVDKRIKLIYGEEYGIFVSSHEGYCTNITLTIPLDEV